MLASTAETVSEFARIKETTLNDVFVSVASLLDVARSARYLLTDRITIRIIQAAKPTPPASLPRGSSEKNHSLHDHPRPHKGPVQPVFIRPSLKS